MTEGNENTNPNPSTDRVVSFDIPEDAVNFYKAFYYLHDGLNDEQRAALTAALTEHKGAADLDEQTKLVYTVGMVIILQEYRRPNIFLDPEYKDQIARRLNISREQIDEWQAQIIQKYDRPATADEQPELDLGLPPPPTPIPVEEQQVLVAITTAFRLSSKLDRKASYFPNSGDAFHTLEIVKNLDLRVKWNVLTPGERITPYDQEVEAAISNIADRRGASIVTYEQIFCMMNGIQPGKGTKAGYKAIEDIRASVKKLNSTEIEITEQNREKETAIVSGRIIDAISVGVKTRTGHTKEGCSFSRPGLLYQVDKHYNKLLSVTTEQLNISAGYWKRGELEAGQGEVSTKKPNGRGWKQVKISITPLSVIIRRYLFMEIFRIRNTPSTSPHSNKITYDAVIKYEDDPALVETDETGERQLKQGKNADEKILIRQKRARRRETVLDILGHFQATGLITGYRETTEGQKKTGVVIEVEKTIGALKAIDHTEKLKRLQAGK